MPNDVPTVKEYRLRPPVASQSAGGRFTINYESELNESQLKAVRTIRGPQLVIAGAGSGKTRTLVYRVAYLIESGIAPESILLLTFTKKAAQEMLRRATGILDGRCSSIHGGTFHSFANMTLRHYAGTLGYQNNFTIADRTDSEDIINLVRGELGYAKQDKRFPKKNTIASIISKSINTGRTHENILFEEYPQYVEEHDAIVAIEKSYQEYKRRNSIMDYDDLLVNLKRLLEEQTDIRARLSQANAFIMLDEFQDTNLMQAEIAYLLASEHNNILAVGDDAQSIYSFRGANFRNIMDFPGRYPNCQITTLEENYRSTQPILNFCNSLMHEAKEKYSKVLTSPRAGGEKPALLLLNSIDEQSAFIAQRTLELREEGVELNKIAVLFRSGWHSNELEVELSARNIPFAKYGGLQFVEASHIKDALSILKIVQNPRDAIAWHRVLLLLDGVGTRTAQAMIERILGAETLQTALGKQLQNQSKYSAQLQQLVDLLSGDVPAKLNSAAGLPAAVEAVCNFYRPLLKTNYEDFKKRMNDIESVERLASRYSNLERFLDDLSLNPPDSSQIGAEGTGTDDEKLTLSTVHSAKGLEWHTVFVMSLIDGFIPSSQSLNRPEDIEEERRLLYVACTRAQDNLYLLCPQFGYSRGYSPIREGYTFSEPSRFLTELANLNQVVDKWAITGDHW